MKAREYGIALNWNYIVISIVVISVLTMLVLYLPGMRDCDTAILKSIRLALSPFPSYIPAFVCSFGNAYNIYMFWPQIVAASVLISHRYYLKTFMLILFTQVAILTKDCIKNFVCRTRPCGDEVAGYSFPSGHATASVCFYGILIYIIHTHIRNDFWRNFLIIVIGIWIFLCCLARLWLGVHFLSDVIAGAFLGFLFVNLYIIFSKSLNA